MKSIDEVALQIKSKMETQLGLRGQLADYAFNLAREISIKLADDAQVLNLSYKEYLKCCQGCGLAMIDLAVPLEERQ